MKYFETKHEKDSAKITALISVIILLLLFVVGAPYMDPPEEYGIAVNFGTTDFGKGNVQPKKLVKSEPRVVEEPPQPEASEAEPTQAAEAKEEVLTAENLEAIAIKKQKAAEAKAKSIADAKAKAEADRIAKEKREQEEKKKKLDALIGGVSKSEGTETGSEGNDNKAGDKGQLDGDPYAPSYFGGKGPGKGGIGYGLGGRGNPSKMVYKHGCNEEGRVVVKIVVDRNGNVVDAEPGIKGTTNKAQCLLEPAKKTAMSFKFPADSKAPTRQIGHVVINFSLSQ
ncbi:MAG: energy transducer TonB [Algibacter sp.]